MRALDARQLLRDFAIDEGDEGDEDFFIALLTSRNVPREDLRALIDAWAGDLPAPKSFVATLKQSQWDELLDQFDIEEGQRDFLLKVVRSRKTDLHEVFGLLQAAEGGCKNENHAEMVSEGSTAVENDLSDTSSPPTLAPASMSLGGAPDWLRLIPQLLAASRATDEALRKILEKRQKYPGLDEKDGNNQTNDVGGANSTADWYKLIPALRAASRATDDAISKWQDDLQRIRAQETRASKSTERTKEMPCKPSAAQSRFFETQPLSPRAEGEATAGASTVADAQIGKGPFPRRGGTEEDKNTRRVEKNLRMERKKKRNPGHLGEDIIEFVRMGAQNSSLLSREADPRHRLDKKQHERKPRKYDESLGITSSPTKENETALRTDTPIMEFARDDGDHDQALIPKRNKKRRKRRHTDCATLDNLNSLDNSAGSAVVVKCHPSSPELQTIFQLEDASLRDTSGGGPKLTNPPATVYSLLRTTGRRLSDKELSDPSLWATVVPTFPILPTSNTSAPSTPIRRSKTSHYFSPAKDETNEPKDKAKRPPSGAISSVPFPPLTDLSFGLVQEELAHDPFRLLIAVTFLVKTKAVAALPVFRRVMELFPIPQALADPAATMQLRGMMHHLGFGVKRVETIQRYARGWLAQPPQAGVRYRVRNYDSRVIEGTDQLHSKNVGIEALPTSQVPARCGGLDAEDEFASPMKTTPHTTQPCKGSDISSSMTTKPGPTLGPIADLSDPSAWEIGHLTQGSYALDSWRIFCRDELLGLARDWNGKGASLTFQPEWMRVLPTDKELRAYLRWMWMRDGWEWNPATGERVPLRKEMRRAVSEGRVEWDEQGALKIIDKTCS